MNPTDLLAHLQGQGLRLYLAGDELRYRGKASALTPDLRQVISASKPALITHLREEEKAISWRAEAMRAQVPDAGPIPFLAALPDVPSDPNSCPSCGDPFTPVGYTPRCHLCTIAAQRVLGSPISTVLVTKMEMQDRPSPVEMFTPYPDQIPRAS